jgi:hypothetical protein
VKLANTHASNLDGVGRVYISASDITLRLLKGIVYFATELRVLIQV